MSLHFTDTLLYKKMYSITVRGILRTSIGMLTEKEIDN